MKLLQNTVFDEDALVAHSGVVSESGTYALSLHVRPNSCRCTVLQGS
jgi:hypothetical protein